LVNIQGTFRDKSPRVFTPENVICNVLYSRILYDNTFGKHSGNIWGTIGAHLVNIQGTTREQLVNIQGTFRCTSGTTGVWQRICCSATPWETLKRWTK
jgi:hypothetical protein